MATQPISAGEFQELVTRYEALEKQANSLLAALSRSRMITTFLFLLLLIFVGVVGYTIFDIYKRVTSPEFLTKITDEGMKRLQDNSGPLQKEVNLLYERSAPVLSKAFQEQAEKDQPKYIKKAEEEWEPFKKELEARVRTRIEEHYKNVLEACRPALEEAVPELKSKPEMYAKLEEGLVSGARASVDKTLAARVKPGFEKLEKNWAAYPMAPEPKQGEMSVGTQIMGHMVELLSIAFTKGDALAAFDESAASPGGNGQNSAPKSNLKKSSEKKGG